MEFPKLYFAHHTWLGLVRDRRARKALVLQTTYLSIARQELMKKGSLCNTYKNSITKGRPLEKPSGLSFRRLLRRSSLCQQRSMNRFEPLVVRGREGGKSGLDCFLDSWHTADLMKSVLRKLVAAHNPRVLKNLKRGTKWKVKNGLWRIKEACEYVLSFTPTNRKIYLINKKIKSTLFNEGCT